MSQIHRPRLYDEISDAALAYALSLADDDDDSPRAHNDTNAPPPLISGRGGGHPYHMAAFGEGTSTTSGYSWAPAEPPTWNEQQLAAQKQQIVPLTLGPQWHPNAQSPASVQVFSTLPANQSALDWMATDVNDALRQESEFSTVNLQASSFPPTIVKDSFAAQMADTVAEAEKSHNSSGGDATVFGLDDDLYGDHVADNDDLDFHAVVHYVLDNSFNSTGADATAEALSKHEGEVDANIEQQGVLQRQLDMLKRNRATSFVTNTVEQQRVFQHQIDLYMMHHHHQQQQPVLDTKHVQGEWMLAPAHTHTHEEKYEEIKTEKERGRGGEIEIIDPELRNNEIKEAWQKMSEQKQQQLSHALTLAQRNTAIEEQRAPPLLKVSQEALHSSPATLGALENIQTLKNDHVSGVTCVGGDASVMAAVGHDSKEDVESSIEEGKEKEKKANEERGVGVDARVGVDGSVADMVADIVGHIVVDVASNTPLSHRPPVATQDIVPLDLSKVHGGGGGGGGGGGDGGLEILSPSPRQMPSIFASPRDGDKEVLVKMSFVKEMQSEIQNLKTERETLQHQSTALRAENGTKEAENNQLRLQLLSLIENRAAPSKVGGEDKREKDKEEKEREREREREEEAKTLALHRAEDIIQRLRFELLDLKQQLTVAQKAHASVASFAQGGGGDGEGGGGRGVGVGGWRGGARSPQSAAPSIAQNSFSPPHPPASAGLQRPQSGNKSERVSPRILNARYPHSMPQMPLVSALPPPRHTAGGKGAWANITAVAGGGGAGGGGGGGEKRALHPQQQQQQRALEFGVSRRASRSEPPPREGGGGGKEVPTPGHIIGEAL